MELLQRLMLFLTRLLALLSAELMLQLLWLWRLLYPLPWLLVLTALVVLLLPVQLLLRLLRWRLVQLLHWHLHSGPVEWLDAGNTKCWVPMHATCNAATDPPI
jgi:hypothetical protein